MNASRNKTWEVPFSSFWLGEMGVPVYGVLAIGFAALVLSEDRTVFAAKLPNIALCVGGLCAWLCGRWLPARRGVTGAALSMLPFVLSLWALLQFDSAPVFASPDGSPSFAGALIGHAVLLGATSFLWRARRCEMELPCQDSTEQLAFQSGSWLLLSGAWALFCASRAAITPSWRFPAQVLDSIVCLGGGGLALVAYRRITRQRRWVADVLAGTNGRWEALATTGPASEDRLTTGGDVIAEDFTTLVQVKADSRESYRGVSEADSFAGALPSNPAVVVSEVARAFDRSVSMAFAMIWAPMASVALVMIASSPVALLLLVVVIGLGYGVSRLREEMRRGADDDSNPKEQP